MTSQSGAQSSVRQQVERLLKTNVRTGTDRLTGFQYRYLCPSPHEYHWQWFWDSCFHAIATAHVDPEHAVAELATLVARQDDDGFIGHMTHWRRRRPTLRDAWASVQSRNLLSPRHSALIQPPVLAQAVERVAEVAGDPSLPLPFMEPLDRYHNWLGTHRAVGEDGLLVTITPDESGTDQSPAFDEALGITNPRPSRWVLGAKDRWLDLRNALAGHDQAKLVSSGPYHMKDPLVNALYADSLASMSRLHRAQGAANVADAYAAQAAHVTQAMVAHLYSRERGAFFALAGHDERRTDPLVVSGLVPLVLEGLPSDIAGELVERTLRDVDKFWLRYPVPSVAATEPSFDARRQSLIWRGPTWVNTNWMIWRGLRRHGFDDLASMLAARTIELVTKSGMREFYNPLNGDGLGTKSFGWSALTLDMEVG